jgi:PST family polysaccharide transporter
MRASDFEDPGSLGEERVARAAAWSLVQTWGRQLGSVLLFLLLARLLEPSAFGIVALTGVFIGITQVLVDQGFADAIVQREDLESEHLDAAFWVNLALSIVLAALIVCSAGVVAQVLHEPALGPVLRWLAPTIVIGALAGVQSGLLRRQLRFKSLALRSLVGISIGGCVGVSMAVAGYGVWSLVGQQLAGAASSTVALWASSQWRPGLRFSLRHVKELTWFGSSVVGTKLLNVLNRRSDDLIIGIVLGPVALGLYTVAYRVLLTLTSILTTAGSQVAFPTFARLQGEAPRLRRAYYRATSMTSILSFPSFIAMAILAPILVPVLLGDQWVASVPVMQVLAFVGIVHAIAFIDGALLVALGRPSIVTGLTAVNSVINIAAFLIAVRWGIVAVAMAYVARAYLVQPLLFLAVRRYIDIDISTYLRQFRGPALATLAMAVVMIASRDVLPENTPAAATLTVSTAAGLAAYLATVWIADRDLLGRAFSLAHLALAPTRRRRA